MRLHACMPACLPVPVRGRCSLRVGRAKVHHTSTRRHPTCPTPPSLPTGLPGRPAACCPPSRASRSSHPSICPSHAGPVSCYRRCFCCRCRRSWPAWHPWSFCTWVSPVSPISRVRLCLRGWGRPSQDQTNFTWEQGPQDQRPRQRRAMIHCLASLHLLVPVSVLVPVPTLRSSFPLLHNRRPGLIRAETHLALSPSICPPSPTSFSRDSSAGFSHTWGLDASESLARDTLEERPRIPGRSCWPLAKITSMLYGCIPNHVPSRLHARQAGTFPQHAGPGRCHAALVCGFGTAVLRE